MTAKHPISDDEIYHITDLLPEDFTLWSDLEEGRAHFADRGYGWWREELGHPKAHRGCCKACGCAASCMLAVFYDSVVLGVIRELARIGVITGLPYMDCPRVDAEEWHGDHSWVDPTVGPCICDGYKPDGPS